jgi:signal transduction histidine kinase
LLIAQTVRKDFRTATDPAAWTIENFDKLRSHHADTALYYVDLALANPIAAPAQQAKLYQLRGIANYFRGDFVEELSSHQEGLRIAERIEDESLQGQILLELSLGTKRQGELDQSIRYGRRAINLCENAGDLDCQAAARRNLGRIYLSRNRDSAVYFLTSSLALRREMRDTIGMSYGLNDLSQLAAEDGRFEEAVSYLEESTAYRRAAGDSSALAININNLGELYLMNEDLPTARMYLEESLVLSTQVRYTALQQHTLGLLADIYEKQGDYPAAYANLQKSASLQDSLYGVEKARAISDLQVAYDTESKQQIIETQAAELRSQRLLGLAVLLGLSLVAALVYYRFYQRSRYERRIAELTLNQKLNAERERISRDLHDSVGANLTRIVTDLDLMTLSESSLPAQTASQIKDTRIFTRSTIVQLRDTIWALNKETFTVAELVGKMEAFLRRYLDDRLQWKVESQISEEYQLNSSQVLNILRILQEATHNMLKHAQAQAFTVTVNSSKEQLNITFEDDGLGMAIATDGEKEQCYGLENMQQRATAIGAKLVTNTGQGGGVRHQLVVGNTLFNN